MILLFQPPEQLQITGMYHYSWIVSHYFEVDTGGQRNTLFPRRKRELRSPCWGGPRLTLPQGSGAQKGKGLGQGDGSALGPVCDEHGHGTNEVAGILGGEFALWMQQLLLAKSLPPLTPTIFATGCSRLTVPLLSPDHGRSVSL